MGVSFTVLAGLFARTALYMTETDHEYLWIFVTDVRRFDVKDSAEMHFQLESLILAQNERWRQA